MAATTGTLIAVVVLIMAVGVAAQVLADRLQVPSVIFLILAGVVVGPEGLGLVRPEVFGESFGPLAAIVGLSVAVIVFEGAFHLKIDRLRESPREALRLVTVGALISLVGTAVVVHYAIGASWQMSMLVGALLIATGPTVITPIMNVVPVRERVAAALETEGIINDVTAAILGVVTFEFLVLEEPNVLALVRSFATRLGAGIMIGLGVAVVTAFLLRRVNLSADNTPQNARLIVLVSALSAYGLAEAGLGIQESGIAAVATAGVVLGNLDLAHEEQIAEFKGDITLLTLSFVFVTLATLLSFEDLLALGVGGIVLVIVVAGLVRPLGVILSTVGDRFTRRERLFMSAMGPRGIIPASVATLFALELEATDPAAASTLVGAVFLVIVATVVFQGGLARHIAQALDVIPMRVIIVGAGRVGRDLGNRLEERGEEVVLIDKSEEAVERARNEGFTVRHGDATDAETLERAGADNAKVVVAATADDDVNLLVAQLARTRFDAETVVGRANQPANLDAFADLDVHAISASKAVAGAMDNTIERPGITQWMTEMNRQGDVQEIDLVSDSLDGLTIAELSERLPDNILIAMVGREGDYVVPESDFEVAKGDRVTVIGESQSAVHEALEQLHPGISL
ncbi:MAG: NhaP-type Na+/H+ or K+/H+ antiporter [Haloarculaceae archaeon]|jgi:NhaP-type Na+/H+ or K+/H+ antiporter